MPTQRIPPWQKPKSKPEGKKIILNAANVKWARARAKAAGRRYPNLVDNLAASRRQLAQPSRSHP
jgi:hypothetical protein